MLRVCRVVSACEMLGSAGVSKPLSPYSSSAPPAVPITPLILACCFQPASVLLSCALVVISPRGVQSAVRATFPEYDADTDSLSTLSIHLPRHADRPAEVCEGSEAARRRTAVHTGLFIFSVHCCAPNPLHITTNHHAQCCSVDRSRPNQWTSAAASRHCSVRLRPLFGRGWRCGQCDLPAQ